MRLKSELIDAGPVTQDNLRRPGKLKAPTGVGSSALTGR